MLVAKGDDPSRLLSWFNGRDFIFQLTGMVRVRRFHFKFFIASKRNKAKRNSFRFRFACFSNNFASIFSLLFASEICLFASFHFRIFLFASFRFRIFLFALFFASLFFFLLRFSLPYFLLTSFRFCIFLFASFRFRIFFFDSLPLFRFKAKINRDCFTLHFASKYFFALFLSLRFFRLISFRFFRFVSHHFLSISHVKSTVSLQSETSEINSISLWIEKNSLSFHLVLLRTENERRTLGMV
jgi:hypothetical protein